MPLTPLAIRNNVRLVHGYALYHHTQKRNINKLIVLNNINEKIDKQNQTKQINKQTRLN